MKRDRRIILVLHTAKTLPAALAASTPAGTQNPRRCNFAYGWRNGHGSHPERSGPRADQLDLEHRRRSVEASPVHFTGVAVSCRHAFF